VTINGDHIELIPLKRKKNNIFFNLKFAKNKYSKSYESKEMCHFKICSENQLYRRLYGTFVVVEK